MDKVVSLDKFRQKKKYPKQVVDNAHAQSIDIMLNEWEYHILTGKSLGNLIADKFCVEQLDYAHDLNAISELEKKVGIRSMIYSPGTMHKDQAGYVAVFHLDDETFSTPEMMLESYARAFNLLIFFYLHEELAQAER